VTDFPDTLGNLPDFSVGTHSHGAMIRGLLLSSKSKLSPIDAAQNSLYFGIPSVGVAKENSYV
jgi:hypothetical protein